MPSLMNQMKKLVLISTLAALLIFSNETLNPEIGCDDFGSKSFCTISWGKGN